MPQFEVINDAIEVNSEECFFIFRLLETHCFNHHFHCYEVTPLNQPEHLFCSQNALANYHVLHEYSIISTLAVLDLTVPLKYHLNENIIIMLKCFSSYKMLFVVEQ